jgi:hypothetical protein
MLPLPWVTAPQLGQLAMEMFLQKNASGSWEQQAVVLQHARAVLQSVRLGSNKLSPQVRRSTLFTYRSFATRQSDDKSAER